MISLLSVCLILFVIYIVVAAISAGDPYPFDPRDPNNDPFKDL